MIATEKTAIVVYVRLGANTGQRRLTFARPELIGATKLLFRNVALDGNQCVLDVPLDNLLSAEKHLAIFLEGFGYVVEFA